jgi:broad specificity phosphatase PhoE/uncharacterized protein YecE (DUF72 family)
MGNPDWLIKAELGTPLSEDAVTFYIIRHGSTALNEADKLRGWLDVPLSKLGLKQAKDISKFFKDIKIDRALSSDLQRAKATAETALGGLGVVIETTPDFRPINFGSLQGQAMSIVEPQMMKLQEEWKTNPDAKAAGGEAFATFQTRNLTRLTAIAEAAKPGDHIAIACHLRNCILFLATAINGGPLEGEALDMLERVTQEPGSVSVLKYDKKTRVMQIDRQNVTDHLEETVDRGAELRDYLSRKADYQESSGESAGGHDRVHSGGQGGPWFVEAAYPQHPDTVIIQPNEFYPDGLDEKAIWSYYDSNKAKLVKELAGSPVLITTVTPKGPVVRRNDPVTKKPIRIDTTEQFDKLNNGRNVEFHKAYGETTDIMAVDIDPMEQVPWSKVIDIAIAVQNALPAGATISFSGGRGFHVRSKLPKPMAIDEARNMTIDLMDKKVVPEFENVTTGINHDPEGTRLDVSTLHAAGSLRVPGSLNAKTGLVAADTQDTGKGLAEIEKGDFTVDKMTRTSRMASAFAFDPNSTENEGRWRLRDPQDFDQESFRRWQEWAGIKAPAGVSFIVGDLENGNKAIQTIRFSKDAWDEPKASKYWESIKEEPGFEKLWSPKDWSRRAELTQDSHPVPEGENEAVPPQKTVQKRGHGIVSAFLDGLTPEQNESRLEQLKNKVSSLGYKFEIMDGSWKGVPEKSLLIKNVPEDVMEGLAKEFGQEAFASRTAEEIPPNPDDQSSKDKSEEVPQQPQSSQPEKGDADSPKDVPPSSPSPQAVPPFEEKLLASLRQSVPPLKDSPQAPQYLESIRQHPLFVKAHDNFKKAAERALPTIRMMYPDFQIDSSDPMSVFQVHEALHDIGMHFFAKFSRNPGTTKEEHDWLEGMVMKCSTLLRGVSIFKQVLSVPDKENALYQLEASKNSIMSYSSLHVIARIVKRDDGYHVLSEKGKNMGGPYKSRDQAEKRLRQIEYFKHSGSLIVGSSGFGHAAWLGGFYPKAILQKDRIGYYSSRFAAVEITSTRHSVPPTRVLMNWAAASPDNFMFTFCAPITVRPSNMATGGADIMRSFMRRIAAVGNKLGPVALYIGPLEKYTDGAAKKFFDALPPHRYAVQIDSQEWQNSEVLDEMLDRDMVVVDTELGSVVTDHLGWSYKRLSAEKISRLKYSIAKNNTNLVFVDDKSNHFPSKDMLQALRDLGIKLSPEELTNTPHFGPTDPQTGPNNSSLPSSAYDDERGEPLTVVKPTQRDDDTEYFGRKQNPIFPIMQYPDLDTNDGKSDPFSGTVDKDTRNI